MQPHLNNPRRPSRRHLLRQIGKPPYTWLKLAHTRSYTLKYGMRAAKLTAVADCIKYLRQDGPLPLP